MFNSSQTNKASGTSVFRVYEVTVSSPDLLRHYKVWENDDATMDAHFKKADEKGLRFFSLTDARGKKIWNIDLWQGWRFKTTVSWKKYSGPSQVSKPPLPPGPPPLTRQDFPILSPSRNSTLSPMSPNRHLDVEVLSPPGSVSFSPVETQGEDMPPPGPPPGPPPLTRSVTQGGDVLSFSRQVTEVLPPPPGSVSFSRQVTEVLPPPPGSVSFSRQVTEVLPPPPGPASFSREDTQGGNMPPPPPRPPKLKRTKTSLVNGDKIRELDELEQTKQNLIEKLNEAGLEY